MKKILLATSAVALFAGAAAAEVTTTGTARMGLVYSDTGVGSSTTVFSSRVRIIFTASGESDSGFSFGASVRNDQSGVGNDANGDSTVFISGAFGKLTMGDVSGAADALVGQTSGVGYGPYDGLQEINFIGTNKTAIYYEYSAGAITFGAGIGQLDTVGPTARDTYNVGVKYAVDGYSVAIGYEADSLNDFEQISMAGSATFGAATVKARISDTNEPGADMAYSVSVDYVTGPTTITAFYTDYGNDIVNFNGNSFDKLAGVNLSTDTQHIGLGVAYDLGGDATLAGGVVFQENEGVPDRTFADVGLKFKF